jgi:hypothetical protein
MHVSTAATTVATTILRVVAHTLQSHTGACTDLLVNTVSNALLMVSIIEYM